MKKINHILATAILAVTVTHAFAKENVGGAQRKGNPGDGGLAAGCRASTNIVNLDLNNVRCPILMNGDMWWDGSNNISRYEIPKGSGKTSLFAGAIWIGGVDASNNLKVAAQTYRQSGSDFWPGPLDTTSASTDVNECLKYDRHWKLLRSEVDKFVNGPKESGYKIPQDILTWPGNGDFSKNEGHFLAPWHENPKKYDPNDSSLWAFRGIYSPEDAGDYPDFDLSKTPTCGHLYGDQNIWWVFNDEGNIHTETGGSPIGLEIRAQAFCFQTNDEINNMTFYNYQIINRSKSVVRNTYFGAWVDPDLGYNFDDFVGCDVSRGLGYVYNGQAFDQGAYGYGSNPPACGLDFFQGPIADTSDGLDNNRDGQIDEENEQIIMSAFVYYNNDFTEIGNPFTATDYYNYLKGIWKDGTPITYGGNGHLTGPQTSFMFPGNTDPTNWGTGLGKNNGPTPPGGLWTEETAHNLPADRRFLQSAGKFTLQPGAVNYITTGAVWARTTTGGPFASVALLQLADDKAQALFDNCFAITNGPDAPDMAIRELSNELIISITPGKFSNDSIEINYNEKDPFVHKSADTSYHFQGYQIFQLKDNSVSITEINNPDKARLVAQCDIKDSISQIVNHVFQANLNAFLPIEQVNGENKGLRHTFDIKTDAFATGTSTGLVNHRTYYYTVLAYAYNSAEARFDPYNTTDPSYDGHSTPYLSGRRNIFTYTAIPHAPDPQSGGLLLNSHYGDAPQIQRLQGQGNGGIVLDMTQASINEALSYNSTTKQYRVNKPVYEAGHGPIEVAVYDPVKVGNHDFVVYLRDTSGSYSNDSTYLNAIKYNSKWYIKELATGEIDSSDRTISGNSEKIFPQWGIRVNIKQVRMPGQEGADNNGFLEGTMAFNDPDNNKRWLTGVPDIDASALDWILAGTDTCSRCHLAPYDYSPFEDPGQIYEKVLGGTWAPFRLAANTDNGPVYNTFSHAFALRLDSLASVDIVLTSDKSLWSRSVVIEEQTDINKAEGKAEKGDPRQRPSVDKEGRKSGDAGYNSAEGDLISTTGMGWFPGYAINIETGERLNIMFGEDSYLQADNGRDMKFNPTSNYFSQFGDPVFGGKHFIYVMGHSTPRGNNNDLSFITVAYDHCNLLKHRLDSATQATSSAIKRNVKNGAWRDCMWVGFPLLVSGHSVLESDVKIRLRVAKSYRNYDVTGEYNPKDVVGKGVPYYKFSTAGMEAQTDQTAVATSALDLINVVPNPYYSYSSYEKNQLDNRVKIVNLPNICTISIYTGTGTLVRRFTRNIPSGTDLAAGMKLQAINNSSISSETSIDWDLKNAFGVPVSGGVYIIHVKADGLGERVIKWFGVIRPIDLDTF